MGFAEPPEHWAPPEPLDATPTWKQYLLVGLLIVGFLGVVGAYSAFAIAPDVVSPPAVVLGSRVVVAASEHPPGTAKRVDVAGAEHTFYLVVRGGDALAVRATWATERVGGRTCEVRHVGEPIAQERVGIFTAPGSDVTFIELCAFSVFDSRGEVLHGDARRNLDRYLVSRRGDRFVVSLDRLIEGRYAR